ncbi:MAG TPA: hypothetical protein VNQ79_27685, partial [Blastocatellia bacterium]|nr:hypothetical protein [Blastocatellia bacterium]
MSFAVGSLVKARGREWVVLPGSEADLLMVRPLGGTEDEATGLLLPLEKVESAKFDLPDPKQHGDYRSSRLLRDAVRLGFRSSAGPFRSFARLAVEPRPYRKRQRKPRISMRGMNLPLREAGRLQPGGGA